MLGKDADRNEYWFFKEDPAKLFVKRFFNQQAIVQALTSPALTQKETGGDAEMINTESKQVLDEVPDLGSMPESQWFFYDEEVQFYKLLESCNIKGIRERRLNENLRKIAERLKLKKMKKPKADAAAPAQPANGQPTITSLLSKPKADEEEKNLEMQDEASAVASESEQEGESQKLQDRHCLFENDDFYESIMNAAWYGKKIPTKRQALQEGRPVGTRGRPAA